MLHVGPGAPARRLSAVSRVTSSASAMLTYEASYALRLWRSSQILLSSPVTAILSTPIRLQVSSARWASLESISPRFACARRAFAISESIRWGQTSESLPSRLRASPSLSRPRIAAEASTTINALCDWFPGPRPPSRCSLTGSEGEPAGLSCRRASRRKTAHGTRTQIRTCLRVRLAVQVVRRPRRARSSGTTSSCCKMLASRR